MPTTRRFPTPRRSPRWAETSQWRRPVAGWRDFDGNAPAVDLAAAFEVKQNHILLETQRRHPTAAVGDEHGAVIARAGEPDVFGHGLRQNRSQRVRDRVEARGLRQQLGWQILVDTSHGWRVGLTGPLIGCTGGMLAICRAVYRKSILPVSPNDNDITIPSWRRGCAVFAEGPNARLLRADICPGPNDYRRSTERRCSAACRHRSDVSII